MTITRRLYLIGVLLTVPLVGTAQHELTGELAKPDGDGPRIVLVAGATGRTGRLLLEELRRNPRFAIRPLARDPKAAAVGHGYGWVQGDVTRPASLKAAMRGVSYVLCAVGATERSGPNSPEFVDFQGVRNLALAAREAGVQQFVLASSMGVGSGGGVWGSVLNLLSGDALEWKAQGEAALRASGVPYTIVRPGGLTDEPGGRTGLEFGQGDEGSGRVSRADTAAVMVAALGERAALRKTFELIENGQRRPGAWREDFARLRPDPGP
jgi:uncharacterized protein YbjT (DUF2867 family)